MKVSIYFLVLNIFLVPILLFGQTEWELEKSKNGIKVFTRHIPTSDYLETYGLTEVDYALESCVALLLDMDVVLEWVYASKKIEILHQEGDTVIIYWLESKAPWPFKNRDAIYEQRLSWDAEKGCVRIDIIGRLDYLPEKDGLVRLPAALGYWEMTPLGKKRTRLEFVMHVEPGAGAPAWVSNAYAVNSPFDSITNFMILIGRDEYQGKEYDFIPAY